MKNEAIFLEEYRKNVKLLCENNHFREKEAEKSMLDAVKVLSRLAVVSRYEGLLALGDALTSNEVTDLPLGKELVRMIGYAINGTEPEILEWISLKRYFTKEYQGREGIFYLMYLDICLEIQAGELPARIDESIKALLPEHMESLFEEYISERNRELEKNKKSGWEIICERNGYGDTDVSDCVRLVDKSMASMSDEVMKKLIKEVDEADFALYLKIMNGTAAKRLRDNLSKQKQDEILEDYEAMGPVRMKEVEETAEVIMKKIKKINIQ